MQLDVIRRVCTFYNPKYKDYVPLPRIHTGADPDSDSDGHPPKFALHFSANNFLLYRTPISPLYVLLYIITRIQR